MYYSRLDLFSDRWLVRQMVDCLDGLLDVWSLGLFFSWLVSWLVGCLDGRLDD